MRQKETLSGTTQVLRRRQVREQEVQLDYTEYSIPHRLGSGIHQTRPCVVID